jgi:large subunit ribosomal protein L25
MTVLTVSGLLAETIMYVFSDESVLGSAGSPLQSAAVSGERIQLEVRERGDAEVGSSNARRLRKQGLIPGVLYGKEHARAIVVGERDLRAALTGPSGLHAIIDVVIEGQKTPHHAVLKDYQQHPIRGVITHIDFHEVRLDQPIHATLSIHLVGDSAGVKQGGVLQQVTRELNVEALPAAIPEYIQADVSALDLGGAYRLEDLPPLEGVVFLDDPHETVLATVTMPRGITELEEADAAEAEAQAAEAAEAAGEVAAEPDEPAPDTEE